ncbi:unnamed protein product [Pseudo-nitzschia multistriata]|uniref:Tyrosine-protein kinase ephrin type A/B receptor-like domain-containing protein n=1 Tax=Pseudo-nitzschia multistriata TaxID=183589 RepID=A0A448Z148_9STRA|nr:unnamed protein product [Pseudo-nitzschia multistriata]
MEAIKQSSFRTMKLFVLIVLAFIVLSNFPYTAAEGNFTNIYATTCQPGSFSVVIESISNCQPCPPGTYSDYPGAEYCKTCLDTIYNGEGADSVEMLSGQLYCINTETLYWDDEVPSEYTITGYPTSLQVAVPPPSAAPSLMPSSTPSNLPSVMPSAMPFLTSVSIKGDSMASFPCNNTGNNAGTFEWYGRCQECPARHETILFPFLVVTLLALLVILLEYLLPSCCTALVWWGIEYLQMIYFIGILSIQWSPIAEFVFVRLLPVFALDLNASFSLQCVIGKNWPQQESADHLFILSLPLLVAILLTFISKISSSRCIRDESVSRWMTLILHMGYLKLVLTSLQIIHLPESWTADVLSSWTKSDPFYATMCGLAGLLFYGGAFPLWLVQSISHFHRLNLALVRDDTPDDTFIGNDEERSAEIKRQQIIKRKQTRRKKELFQTIGILPIILGPKAWWWPGFWMLRKMLFSVLLVLFPDKPVLLLIIFLLVHFLSVIIQQCTLPLVHEDQDQAKDDKKKWCHVATVDTVLQFCLAAMLGVAFFSLWSTADNGSTRSSFQKHTEGSMVLSILLISLIYLTLAIGVCCARSDPRFKSVASQIVFNTTKNDNNTSTSGSNDPSRTEFCTELSFKRSFSTESSSSQDSNNDIVFFGGSQRGMNSNLIDEEYADEFQDGTVNDGVIMSASYLVEEIDENGRERLGNKQKQEKESPKIFRSDPSVSKIDEEDDTTTVYEEIWVDEETGNEISAADQGNWVDTETGSLVVPLG